MAKDAIDRTLSSLRSLSPPELLQELAWLRQRVADGEQLLLPLVTLHLRSGRDAAGVVREIRRESRGSWIVLHQPGFDRPARDDVGFYSLDSVEAVTVHDLPALDRPPPDLPEPPGRLEVKRHMADLKGAVSGALGAPIACDAAWDTFPDGEPMRALAEAIAQLRRILEELAGEALGLEAIKQKVKAISFAPAAERTGAQMEAQTLKVEVALTPRLRISQAELKKSVEAAL